ncbi:MAG: alpha/beta hydrolase [Pseudomonadota bacterium]
MNPEDDAIETRWIHLQYEEASAFNETYGFSGSQGAVNVEGLLLRARGSTSRTLLVYMHPASTLQLLPVPRAMARSGVDVLCAASRYAKNDAALIMEKVILDLGAWIRHAREVLGYQKVVLAGWSGGGSLAMFYQAEAEAPSITHTPAGDPVHIGKLPPADAVIYQAAHISRASLLAESLDPSVQDELHPGRREPELDIYDPRNPNRPPYTAEYIQRYRAAQLARMRRITAWVKATLQELKEGGTDEMERGFVVHRTQADPRFSDPSLDPNGRRPGWCYMGKPETVNSGPVGLARFCTLRSWLSQWSLDDSRADALSCAARMHAPLMVIENGADDAVPQPHSAMVFNASVSPDKTMHIVPGANHYYAGQPELLAGSIRLILDWLGQRGLLAVK